MFQQINGLLEIAVEYEVVTAGGTPDVAIVASLRDKSIINQDSHRGREVYYVLEGVSVVVAEVDDVSASAVVL